MNVKLILLIKPPDNLVSVGSLRHVIFCHSLQYLLTLYVSSSFLARVSSSCDTRLCYKSGSADAFIVVTAVFNFLSELLAY